MTKLPMVSVIITSMGTEILKRSIQTVLNQTYSNLEIIVVVDDNIRFTDDILKNARILSAKNAHNANKSRNIGIEEARGEYIALLDDDDLWDSDKIKTQVFQMQRTKYSSHYFSYVQTNLVKNGIHDGRAYPHKGIRKGEEILDYFFGRSKGFIQTSSFFGDSELFKVNKFDETIIKHQDWDWLINAKKMPGLEIDFIPSVLTYYTVNNLGTSVGTKQQWRFSEKWFNSYIDTVTDYTRASFYSKVILRSLLNDHSLNHTDKKMEVRRILRIISMKHPHLYLKSLIKIILATF